jgi:hypothetical protein
MENVGTQVPLYGIAHNKASGTVQEQERIPTRVIIVGCATIISPRGWSNYLPEKWKEENDEKKDTWQTSFFLHFTSIIRVLYQEGNADRFSELYLGNFISLTS